MVKNRIVPTLFAYDKVGFVEKLKLLSGFVQDIHIDFMDGSFTPKSSVPLSDMIDVKSSFNINFEIHLMCYNPEKYIEEIKNLGITKAFIHFEVFSDLNVLNDVIDRFFENGIEVGIAVNPETNISLISDELLEKADSFMLMSVVPGAEGQKFMTSVYEKIKRLRDYSDKVMVYVDGGINDSNVQELLETGANVLCVGSFVSSSKRPEENYNKLVEFL